MNRSLIKHVLDAEMDVKENLSLHVCVVQASRHQRLYIYILKISNGNILKSILVSRGMQRSETPSQVKLVKH